MSVSIKELELIRNLFTAAKAVQKDTEACCVCNTGNGTGPSEWIDEQRDEDGCSDDCAAHRKLVRAILAVEAEGYSSLFAPKTFAGSVDIQSNFD